MDFRQYRITNDLYLGQYNRTLGAGSIVEYNGVTLRFPDTGETLSVPLLAKAIQGGVAIVPVESEETSYRPRPAGVEMRAASSPHQDRGAVLRSVTVSEEDSLAGTVGHSNQRRQAAYRGEPAPAPLMTPGQQRRIVSVDEADEYNTAVLQDILNQPYIKAEYIGGNRYDDTGETGKAVGKGKYSLIATDGQQGEEVGVVRSSRNSAVVGQEGDARKVAATGAAIRIDKTRPEDIEGRVSEVAIQQANAQRTKSGAVIIPGDDDITDLSGQIVRPRTASTQIRQTPGVQHVSQLHSNGATGDVSHARSGEDLTGLLPQAAVPRRTAEEAIQRIVDNWDMTRSWQERLEEAVDFYGNRKDILRAIYSVEAPGVQRKLNEIFHLVEPVAPEPVAADPAPSVAPPPPSPPTGQKPKARVKKPVE